MRSPKLLRDRAYALIKQKIVTLEYPIGRQLVEQDICEELGIGRTPVREALQRLAAERLITIIPRRGMFVSQINLWELQRLIETRVMIDVFCARTAAVIRSQAQVDALRALFDDAEQKVIERRIPELLEIDRRFHLGIVAIVDNPLISEIAEKIYDQLMRTWFLSFSRRTTEEIRETVREHMAIVNALEAGQSEAAEREVLRHLESYRRKVLQQGSRDSGLLQRDLGHEVELQSIKEAT